MRKSLIILVLTLLMVLGTSCKNYKETNKIIYEEPLKYNTYSCVYCTSRKFICKIYNRKEKV